MAFEGFPVNLWIEKDENKKDVIFNFDSRTFLSIKYDKCSYSNSWEERQQK